MNIGAQCTTVSKLCSSSIKAVGYASMSIAKGDSKVALAGGYESMSNVPYLIPNVKKNTKSCKMAKINIFCFLSLVEKRL